jgi:Replication-relaxation
MAMPAVATEIMESLYQHRVLSTTQIHELHTSRAHKSFSRRLLGTLHKAGVVECVSGAGRLKLWYLTKRGNDAIETIGTRAEHRRKQVSADQAAGPLRMHTLAVNDVGIAFVNASRERGDDCGPLAWRHEIAHPIAPRRHRRPGDMVIADALLTYTQRRSDRTLRVHQRFVELDRATIPLQALCEKFDRYARLRDYTPEEPGREARRSGWRAYYDQFPGVLVIFAHRDRKTLQRRMQNMIALHQADVQTRGLTVLTGLLEDLCEHGPFAPIFIDPQNPERYLDWLGKPQPENQHEPHHTTTTNSSS